MPVIRSAAARLEGEVGRAWCVLCQFWASCTCRGTSTWLSLEVYGTNRAAAPLRRKGARKVLPSSAWTCWVSAYAAGAAWQPFVELVLMSSVVNAVACRGCSMCRSCGAPPKDLPLLGKHPCSLHEQATMLPDSVINASAPLNSTCSSTRQRTVLCMTLRIAVRNSEI